MEGLSRLLEERGGGGGGRDAYSDRVGRMLDELARAVSEDGTDVAVAVVEKESEKASTSDGANPGRKDVEGEGTKEGEAPVTVVPKEVVAKPNPNRPRLSSKVCVFFILVLVWTVDDLRS